MGGLQQNQADPCLMRVGGKTDLLLMVGGKSDPLLMRVGGKADPHLICVGGKADPRLMWVGAHPLPGHSVKGQTVLVCKRSYPLQQLNVNEYKGYANANAVHLAEQF
jgi:hypothetical protein